MFIDGQWTHAKSEAVFDVFNPATNGKPLKGARNEVQ
jgi:acyl-CoA reductase-like NAD-dependent aldehyde dehydrogenase